MRTLTFRTLWCLVAVAAAGCAPEKPSLYTRLQDENPAVRLQAVHEAGNAKDVKAVPYLVDRLTDSDADVRMFAILALERITGQTHGYKYFAAPRERKDAADRWRKWLDEEYPTQMAGRKGAAP